MTNIAIENSHKNNGFSNQKLRFSILLLDYPQDEGFAQRANPEGWPSNHQPIGKINLSSMRVSFRVHTSYKIPRPDGTIRHISITVSFRVHTSYKIPRPHGTIRHISIRLSYRADTSYRIPRPHGTIRHFSARVAFRVYITPKKWKTRKGRHAWNPQRLHISD